jgi:hypothetical protein
MDKFITITATMLFSIACVSAYVFIYVIPVDSRIGDLLIVLLFGFCIGATFHMLYINVLDAILDYLDERRISKTLEELR